MSIYRTNVGLDVHASKVVACALDEDTGELLERALPGEIPATVAWLATLPGPVRVAYEAGPTGFALSRALTAAGIACEIAAPSKLQRPVGERVKTDRRDAAHLLRLLRLEEIVGVRVPTIEQEGVRDLTRNFEDERGLLMAARHRTSKHLLRRGIVWDGGTTWTLKHLAWLRQQRFEQPAAQFAFDNELETVLQATARQRRLEAELLRIARDSEFTPIVRRLGVLRGMSEVTALSLAVEIGDWDRFTGASIGSFVGLVPSEYSSGASRSQGSITKVGNAHARRLLVTAAWQHRRPLRPGAPTQQRREALVSAPVRVRGEAGNRRLHQRWQRFTARKVHNNIADVGIARELAGWCWSLATMDER